MSQKRVARATERAAHRRAVTVAAVMTGAALTLTGCGSGGSQGSMRSGSVAVTATENECAVAASSLPSGPATFAVTNTGDRVTEVYVYAQGDRVIGEVENVGPGTSRDLIIALSAGDYQVVCKPGMVGSGIRTALRVTGSAAPAEPKSALLTDGVASYRAYVRTETQALVDTTGPLVAAIVAGDAAKARELYPSARTHYERIEPVAESFGDLDPSVDMRADDVEPGKPFTGFHRLEQDLFATGDVSGSGPVANALLADTHTLADRIPGLEMTPLSIANGAKSLLDEVAKSKVTGEEERYSHIDLVDFAGNVDGARTAIAALRPVVAGVDPNLATTLDARFTSLQSLLDTHLAAPSDPGAIVGSAYVSYLRLRPDQIKALAAAVDSLSEPLGRVPATVPVQ